MTDPVAEVPDDALGQRAPSAKARLLSLIRVVVGFLVLAAISVALQRNWAEVSSELSRLSGAAFGGALALAVASPILTLLGWRALLVDLGARLSLPASASVFLVGQLGKYVPGSVWSVAIQSDMGGRLGVPRRTLGVAGLLSIALAVLTAAVLGLPAVPLLVRTGSDSLSFAGVALAVLLLLVLIWPPVLNALITRGLRLLRREPLPHPLGGRAIVTCVGWFVLAWLSMGGALWVLAADIAPTATVAQLVLTALSGYCLAAALGMLSVVVPAGVGVRDGLLALLLLGLMPVGAATAVVVVHRFVSLLGDLLTAAAGFAWARSHHLIGARHE